MHNPMSAIMAAAIILALLTSLEAAATRDLGRYETRGPYVLHGHIINQEDRSSIASQMKEFLLNCWQEHRLGRLITVEFSLEGEPTRTTYFIEPDASGAWRVVVETLATRGDIQPGGNERHTEERTRTAKLVKIKGADGKKRVRIVSDDNVILLEL